MSQIKKPLTVEEVKEFPSFANHDDAAAFLKERYGGDFIVYRKPLMHEKRLMYSYLLILDRENFEKLQEYSRNHGGTELIPVSPETKHLRNTNQTIYIFEDGEILPIL